MAAEAPGPRTERRQSASRRYLGNLGRDESAVSLLRPDLRVWRLIARAPSPLFVTAAGSVLALVLTLFSSFEGAHADGAADLLSHVGPRLFTDYASLCAVVAVVWTASVIVPQRVYSDPPAIRAVAASFAPYTLAGLVGGIARYNVRSALGLAWAVEFPSELLANMGAGAIAFSMVGILASQYYPLVERLERLRALSAMAQQAAEIAATKDFRRRVGLATRTDEVGDLARTVNYLLAAVETTLAIHHEFLADTSHELRNPLLALRANLELIERVRGPAARSECARESVQQVDRMSRLVSDLLTLARLDSGQIVERRPVRLLPIVIQEVRETERLAAGRQVRLTGREDLWVVGDHGRLRQILGNLTGNAIQHTPPGGTISVQLSSCDGRAQLVVSDTGEGIAPEHLPHIFNRFYSVGKASASGSGLGLAIARHLAEAHRGGIEVQSTPGEGSTFTVWLPLMFDHPGRKLDPSESLPH